MDQYLIEYFQSQTNKLQNTLNIVDNSKELLNINRKDLKKSLIIKNKFHDIQLSKRKHKLLYNNIRNGPFLIYIDISSNHNAASDSNELSEDMAGYIWQMGGNSSVDSDKHVSIINVCGPKPVWKLRAKGNLKGGKLSGYVEQYYPNIYDVSSQCERSTLSCNPTETDSNICSDKYIGNTNLLSKTYYERGIKQFIYQEFYIGGTPKLICNYINNKKYGLFVKYHQNGNICIKCEFFHDSMINNYKAFHYDGSIKLNYNYNINGYLDGEIIEYYVNPPVINIDDNTDNDITDNINDNTIKDLGEIYPRIKLISNYCDGELNGSYKLYHKNRKIKISCNYVNNDKHGLYKEYDEQGNLILQCNYNNGELHGPYMKYKYSIDSLNSNKYSAKSSNNIKCYSLICNYYYGKVDGLYREIINGETSDKLYKNGKPIYQNSNDFDIFSE